MPGYSEDRAVRFRFDNPSVAIVSFVFMIATTHCERTSLTDGGYFA